MDVYEIFALLSGIILLGAALVPGLRGKDRAGLAIGGIGVIVYAVYVANQTSGTYYFSWVFFVLPFVTAGYLGLRIWHRLNGPAAQAGAAPDDEAGEVPPVRRG